jgi:hypothetical protein
MAIPKVIHYCWFGGKELPESAKKCIMSWKTYFVGYEIIEWNESNYDVNKIIFTKEAYEVKKYAFVSDYARFDILYNLGGIYFDTDVEVIKPFGDIVQNGAFMGFESIGGVAVGLGMGSIAGNNIFRDVLNYYKKQHFILQKGRYNTRTVVSIVTEIMRKYGLRDEDRIQYIEGIKIYPIEYFCPKSFETGKTEITKNTVSIHHYDGSWVSEDGNKITKERWEFYERYGEDKYIIKYLEKNDINRISLKVLYKVVIKRSIKKILGEKLNNKVREYFNKKNGT